jgi:hypothetical protein
LHEQGLGALYITVLGWKQYPDHAAATCNLVELRRNDNKGTLDDMLDLKTRSALMEEMDELDFDDEYMQRKGR